MENTARKETGARMMLELIYYKMVAPGRYEVCGGKKVSEENAADAFRRAANLTHAVNHSLGNTIPGQRKYQVVVMNPETGELVYFD